MNNIATYLEQLDQASREWLGELGDDITEAELVWQPFVGGHSIAALLVHIAEVEQYWLHHVAVGEPYRDMEGEFLEGGVIDQYEIQWATPSAGRLLAFYTEILAATRARTKELMSNVELSLVAKRREQEFTLHWLLTHVIVHEAYHGGQAVLLLLQQRKAVS